MLSIYIYSRASGRLVQYEQDARTMLGLNAGGAEFCQALTVIIDDIEGHLPLDPTKQGVAFGHQTNGHVHQENLFSVVCGITQFYYHYHKKKYGSKKVLTAKILELTQAKLPNKLKSIQDLVLTDYGVHFSITKHNRIQVDHTCRVEEEVGPDTIFCLLPEVRGKDKAGTSSVAKKTQRKKKAAKVTPIKALKQQSIAKAKPASSKHKRLKEPKTRRNLAEKTKQRPTRLWGIRSSTRKIQKPAFYQGELATKSYDMDDSEMNGKSDQGELATKSHGNDDMDDSDMNGKSDNSIIDLCSDDEDEMTGKYIPTHCPQLPAWADESDEDSVAAAEDAKTSEESGSTANNAAAMSLEIERLNAKVVLLQSENESLKKELIVVRKKLEQNKNAPTVKKVKLEHGGYKYVRL